MKKSIFFLILLGVIVNTAAVFAAPLEGFGDVATSILNPLGVLTEFLEKAALIIGIAFIFGSFIRYLQHRKNPLAVPLGGVITLLILGIMLVFLPLAYKLSDDTPPYVVVDKSHEAV